MAQILSFITTLYKTPIGVTPGGHWGSIRQHILLPLRWIRQIYIYIYIYIYMCVCVCVCVNFKIGDLYERRFALIFAGK